MPAVSQVFGLIASDFLFPLQKKKNFFFFHIDLEELYHSETLDFSFSCFTGQTDRSPLCLKFFSQKV